MRLKLCNTNKIINQIADISIGSTDYYGRHLQKLFANNSEIGLLFIEDKLYMLASPKFDTANIEQLILLWLTRLLAELNSLINNRYCLQVPSAERKDFLCCVNANELNPNGINQYSVGNGMSLIKDEKWIIKKGEDVILQEVAYNKTLYDELYNLLLSKIYPTDNLLHYIKRKYRTIEEDNVHTSLMISIMNIIVALVICCLSLIGGVWMGNKYGKTELKEKQYKSIINNELKIDSSIIALDKKLSQDTMIVKLVNVDEKHERRIVVK